MAKKILVADDEPEIVLAVAMLLKSRGYEVVTGEDGIQATQIAIKEKPDLIILDISMPAGDGHTVCQRLRSSPQTAGIPILFLTARDTVKDMKQAMEEGAAGYMTKPYQPKELLDKVKELIEIKELIEKESQKKT
jgi:DNA-binding response OmpR family regulator